MVAPESEEYLRCLISDLWADHFYYNGLVMRNTANVAVGKPFTVWSQSILGGIAYNLFIIFYDIHGRKREVLFFFLC
jgi:hypothetical protein